MIIYMMLLLVNFIYIDIEQMPRQSRNMRRIAALNKARARAPLTRRQVKAVKKIALSTGELKKREWNADNVDLYAGNGASLMTSGLTDIIQGDGDGERVGDKIKLKKVVLRGVVDAKSAQAACLRLYIVQTHFDSTGSGFGDIAPDEFMPDADAVGGNYTLLYDKIMYVNPNGNEKRHFKVSIPGKKLKPVKYDAAATTIATGQLFAYLVPDDNVTTGNIDLDCNGKLFYYDS